MGFLQLKKQQTFHQPIEELWDFISNPENLKQITPDSMGFEISSKDLPDAVYEGMIIRYKVSPLFGIKTTWVTEITHVKHLAYFVDEQRVGPYKMWHHQHFLEATENGTLMSDIISYQPPFGVLGNLANTLFIQRKLEEIFDYRFKALNEIFGDEKNA